MNITIDNGNDPIELALRHDGRIVLTRRTSACCGQAIHIEFDQVIGQALADGLNDLIMEYQDGSNPLINPTYS